MPYDITLTVRGATRVQGIAFARRITATYNNPDRSDATPCPLGPSRDAARYSGAASSPLPSPPQAAFVPAHSGANTTIAFTGQSRPGIGGARIVASSWQFGDPQSGATDTSSLQSPSHTFSQPGIYTVTLTVTDANALYSTIASQVTAPGPPSAAFTATEQGTSATFSFQDTSTSGIGNAPIVAWHWDFGDPSSGTQDTSSAQNPSHAFSAPGDYTVTLTVSDANGYTNSRTQTVDYAAAPGP